MASPDDEDSETLITDASLISEESTDDNQTLVVARGRDESTLITAPLAARLARRQAVEQAAMPVRHLPPPPPADPEPNLGADPERRMLPFATSARRPISAPPPSADFDPLNRTQAMVGAPAHPAHAARAQPTPRALGPAHAPAPAPAARAVAPGPAPAPQLAPARASVAPSPPAPAPQPAVAPIPVAARPTYDAMVMAQEQGTPPIVIRFLLVCGLLTVVGLLALIYLEL